MKKEIRKMVEDEFSPSTRQKILEFCNLLKETSYAEIGIVMCIKNIHQSIEKTKTVLGQKIIRVNIPFSMEEMEDAKDVDFLILSFVFLAKNISEGMVEAVIDRETNEIRQRSTLNDEYYISLIKDKISSEEYNTIKAHFNNIRGMGKEKLNLVEELFDDDEMKSPFPEEFGKISCYPTPKQVYMATIVNILANDKQKAFTIMKEVEMSL